MIHWTPTAGYVGPVPIAPARIGGVDAGECDQFQITWPSDVDRFKANLAPFFDATDQSAKVCAALPPAERAAWEDFFARWRAFAARATPLFGSSNERELACTFAHQLDGFREKIRRTCAIAGPVTVAPRSPQIGPSADLVKWGVVGVAVVGVVALALFYGPEIKAVVR